MSELGNILLELRDTDVTSGRARRPGAARSERRDSRRQSRCTGAPPDRPGTEPTSRACGLPRPTSSNITSVARRRRVPGAGSRAVAVILSGHADRRPSPPSASAPGAPSIDAPGDLAALTFATAERGAVFVTLSMPNERLLLIQSDIEVALGPDLRSAQDPGGTAGCGRSRPRSASSRSRMHGAGRRTRSTSASPSPYAGRRPGSGSGMFEVSAHEAWLLKSVIDQIEDELEDTSSSTANWSGSTRFAATST